MTEKEIQERLEREEVEENCEKGASKSVTVNDILDKLEEDIVDDNDNRSVQITLFPPVCDAIDSDGDSDDEDAPTCSFSHLSRKLLDAEGEIHEADKTCDSQDEIEEDLGVFPSPSSSKGNNNNKSKTVKNTSIFEVERAQIGGKKGVKKSSSLEAEGGAKIGGRKGVKNTSSLEAEGAKIGGKKGVKETSD